MLRNDRESHGTETDRASEGHADGHLPPGSLRQDAEVASAVSGTALLTTRDTVLALKDEFYFYSMVPNTNQLLHLVSTKQSSVAALKELVLQPILQDGVWSPT